jgi:hypothetical protein
VCVCEKEKPRSQAWVSKEKLRCWSESLFWSLLTAGAPRLPVNVLDRLPYLPSGSKNLPVLSVFVLVLPVGASVGPRVFRVRPVLTQKML